MAITEPNSLDPSRASNVSAMLVMKVLCDTLVSFDPRTGALVPGLAQSWTVAPDAKSVTLKLRDAKFHNGRKLVAQDVVYSISRFVHPKTGSPEFFFFDRVAGYADVRQEKTDTLGGVKAIDESTVQVEMSEPFAEMPAVLSHPAAGAVVPKEEVDKGADAFALRPSCTGPYTPAEPYVKGQKLTLIRSGERDHEIEGVARGGAGFANKVEFRIVADAGAGLDLLKKSEVEVAEVPISRLDEARSSKAKVVSGTNGHLAYIGFPVTKPPFDNTSVRRALALDVDRTHIIDDLLAGTRGIPRGFLPPAAGKLSRTSCSDGVKPRSDVKAAKAAFTSSGVDPAGVKPTVYLNSSGGHERWLQPVIDRWGQDFGVTATMKAEEWKTYLDHLVDPGVDGPFRLAWAVKYPSPEALLGPLFGPGSPDNFTRYAGTGFLDALTKARGTPADNARAELYVKALQGLCADMPIIPMWFGQSHHAFAPTLATPLALDVFGDPILREIGFPAG